MANILLWLGQALYIYIGCCSCTISMSQKGYSPNQAIGYPFEDPSLPWDERVDDLVGRLTVPEITAQMARGGRASYVPAIPRLGIKPYPWDAECLRGDVQAGPATSFPQAIGMSATFSREVLFNVSRATGLEVRAKFNNYSSHGDYGLHTSASCWSPVINIMRDPRWGRNQETYGEDPFMSGEMAWAFVKGLQGDDERYVMVNAGCKHFAVYAGPENIPESRHSFDAKVSERDLRMTFLPQFKRCVEAGTYSLMCSYNSVNGIPACANSKLLKDILRDEWGFKGYVISDEGAIEDILDNHKYTSNLPDTAAVAVNAGTNLEDGHPGATPYFDNITDAVNLGKIKESTIRDAVKPLFYTRMRLGEFDPADKNPFAKLKPEEYVQSPEHRELAIQTALRSFVLLKNIDFLPLNEGKKFDTLAIVGPVADNVDVIFGGYAPTPDPRYIKTPRAGLKDIASNENYAAGCTNSDPKCEDYDSDSVKQAVATADLVVVCLGTGFSVESEGNDRSDINLPGKQLQLLQDAVETANGKPVVLLLFNAGPLDISYAKDAAGIVAIVECFFPAQAAGEALYRMFYNKGVAANPAGRLPATWPASLSQVPPITNYTMEGRTYRYFNGTPLYPFGYGLSYTLFKYDGLFVPSEMSPRHESISLNVTVYNQGEHDGEEVVQVYTSYSTINTTIPLPKIQLVNFSRVFIKAMTSVKLQITITRKQLEIWVDDKGFTSIPALMNVYVGGQQPNQKTTAPSNVVSGSFKLMV